MAESGNSNFGLSAKDFYRLSQLEEAVFLAIRDGKITLSEYVNFIRSFLKMKTKEFNSDFEGGLTKKGAHLITKMEYLIGLHLEMRDEGVVDYLEQFKKFLKSNDIDVDFRKTPLR